MENLALLLQQTRESRRLTLKDVETATRIPMSYLLALEGGAGLLSDQVYLVPFLRTYAKFLGLDTNAVVGQFVAELQRTDSRAGTPPERRTAAPSAPSAPSRLSFWALPFLLFLGILLVGSFLWQNGFSGFDALQSTSLTKMESSSDQETVPVPSSPETSGTDLPTPVVSAPSEPTSPIAVAPPSTNPSSSSTQESPSGTSPTTALAPTQTEPVPAVTAPPQPTPVVDGSSHRLNIQASSPTWVRIVVDDQPPKEMIIKAGESREWSGQQGFTLSLGNAGGVTLNLDGQDLPPVGKSGQVVRNIQLPANLSPSTNMTR
jgi:cytoskeleton protein RodZ